MSSPKLDQVNGPVYVVFAEPGDTLQVDVLDVQTADWGWTALIPGFGLLADEYEEPALKVWKIEKDGNEEGYAWFDELKGIKIRARPSAVEMGVARGEKGAFSTIPPYHTGVSSVLVFVGRSLFFCFSVNRAMLKLHPFVAVAGTW